MVYEVGKCAQWPDEWLVEAIDHGSEGEIYAVRFSGQGAESRAREYAAWKEKSQPAPARVLGADPPDAPAK